MMKAKATVLVRIAVGLAMLGVDAQSIAVQAGDESPLGKNNGAQVLSTANIGKTPPGPRNANAKGITLATSPPQIDTHSVAPMPITIYVNVMPTGDGYGGYIRQQSGNHIFTADLVGGNNLPVGNAMQRTSHLRIGGVPVGQQGPVGNPAAGNYAAYQNGGAVTYGGMSAQNLNAPGFGAPPSLGAGHMRGALHR